MGPDPKFHLGTFDIDSLHSDEDAALVGTTKIDIFFIQQWHLNTSVILIYSQVHVPLSNPALKADSFQRKSSATFFTGR